jgi:hypothetical protein
VPLNILGELPQPLDTIVREVLHRALDARPQEFVVEISRPHGDVIVHVLEPFERRLKFNYPMESEIARELSSTVTAIVDEEFGPVNVS